ncbi:hypothetical protein FJT64_009323 [Amphibalanus amphitrite]|uniref:Uncharacterized protein n=1 Tax=Amphibalanus amphitrite TaxID=1232801 RepID=A0A6A4VMD5_AMPAM|nr:hypothetical protein FJT64_009323 [Amphibalanus amphitrite]
MRPPRGGRHSRRREGCRMAPPDTAGANQRRRRPGNDAPRPRPRRGRGGASARPRPPPRPTPSHGNRDRTLPLRAAAEGPGCPQSVLARALAPRGRWRCRRLGLPPVPDCRSRGQPRRRRLGPAPAAGTLLSPPGHGTAHRPPAPTVSGRRPPSSTTTTWTSTRRCLPENGGLPLRRPRLRPGSRSRCRSRSRSRRRRETRSRSRSRGHLRRACRVRPRDSPCPAASPARVSAPFHQVRRPPTPAQRRRPTAVGAAAAADGRLPFKRGRSATGVLTRVLTGGDW